MAVVPTLIIGVFKGLLAGRIASVGVIETGAIPAVFVIVEAGGVGFVFVVVEAGAGNFVETGSGIDGRGRWRGLRGGGGLCS